MRFPIAYLLAYSIVQTRLAFANIQPPITESLSTMLVWNVNAVACLPFGCNGIQPYEWVAFPLAGVSALGLLGMSVRGTFV